MKKEERWRMRGSDRKIERKHVHENMTGERQSYMKGARQRQRKLDKESSLHKKVMNYWQSEK